MLERGVEKVEGQQDTCDIETKEAHCEWKALWGASRHRRRQREKNQHKETLKMPGHEKKPEFCKFI